MYRLPKFGVRTATLSTGLLPSSLLLSVPESHGTQQLNGSLLQKLGLAQVVTSCMAALFPVLPLLPDTPSIQRKFTATEGRNKRSSANIRRSEGFAGFHRSRHLARYIMRTEKIALRLSTAAQDSRVVKRPPSHVRREVAENRPRGTILGNHHHHQPILAC